MKHIVSTHANTSIGVLLIITSAISFGVMPIFARLAYSSGADPITILLLRFGIAAVVMMGIMLLSKTPFPRGLVLLELILLGAIGYVGESLAYFTALTMASPGLVALLLYIYPALVTALSAIFLKEHLTTIKVVALFLALSGTVLTIQITSGGSITGILLGIAAAVDYAIYILLGSRIVRRSGSIGSTSMIIASTAGGSVRHHRPDSRVDISWQRAGMASRACHRADLNRHRICDLLRRAQAHRPDHRLYALHL